MPIAYAIIHDELKTNVLDLIPYESGDQVEVLQRDPIWETGQTEEGVPYRRFIRNGDPYTVQKAKKGGGFIHIGKINNWHVVMIASKAANLKAINDLSANKVIGLALVTVDADGNRSGWAAKLDESDRARISTWMAANGFLSIPEEASARQAVRQIWRAINATFDELSFDMKAE